MKEPQGIFTISLDFELYWGMQDVIALQYYKHSLEGTENAIKSILNLFHVYGIHATWATVGFLFARDIEELKTFLPEKLPRYVNNAINPYLYMDKVDKLEKAYHFAPELIKVIDSYDGQEIGTHTFSHYYCLERGQTKDQFRSDILSAIAIANASHISLKSLVFPRNERNDSYLSILFDCGISNYRGNGNSWLNKAVSLETGSILRRALRLLDAYLNISGQNCYKLEALAKTKPYDIPASRFLRPAASRYTSLEKLRKKRIQQGIKYAAQKNKFYHLWWHPHNFGVNTDNNLQFLEDILSYYKRMNKEYGMQSLNMNELSVVLDSLNE